MLENQQTNTRIGIAPCYLDLKGRVPTEVRLIPDGEFRARDGRPHEPHLDSWKLDARSAAEIITTVAASHDDRVIDYEHQTLLSEQNGKPAPAAGWFKQLQYRPGDGLYAVNIKWTDAARTHIMNMEYRYLSPVLLYDRQSGVVTGLEMASLTNHPAIDNLDDLTRRMAARYRLNTNFLNNQPKEYVMNEKIHTLLGLDADADAAAVEQAIVSLKKNAEQAEQMQTQMVALKQQLDKAPDPEKYAPVAVLKAVTEENAALKAAFAQKQVAELVDQGLEDGRILPAQKNWATELGKSNIEALKSFLDSAVSVAALKAMQSDVVDAETGKRQTLDEADMAVCKAMHIDPEAYKQTKEEK